ncbi:MAG: hypothetical protein AW12_02106 [Candidatus Accumulibacter sp. BA-94]|nr:MAG: hypothetical protein AW12_02106 [Candidatus Accumulibacter sp. BA-94]
MGVFILSFADQSGPPGGITASPRVLPRAEQALRSPQAGRLTSLKQDPCKEFLVRGMNLAKTAGR